MDERDELAKRLSEEEELDHAVRLAVDQALKRHERLGHKVAVWRDGAPAFVHPEEREGT